ncbi:hypothetical protein IKD56_03985 [bacterium]|nr:hypothetical protein [bacterium]
MINEYDRPSKGYKTFEQYEHPATVLYDNWAPKVEEEVFVETAVEEISEVPAETVEEMVEVVPEEVAEEIVEEKEGEE